MQLPLSDLSALCKLSGRLLNFAYRFRSSSRFTSVCSVNPLPSIVGFCASIIARRSNYITSIAPALFAVKIDLHYYKEVELHHWHSTCSLRHRDRPS